MSLSKYLKALSTSTSEPHRKMAEEVGKLARWSTLTALHKRMPFDKKITPELAGLIKEADTRGLSFYHPKVPIPQVDDLKDEFAKKLYDVGEHGKWTELGQPSLKEMNQFSEDLATPIGDKLGLSADEIDDSLKKLQRIYGYVATNQKEFPDAMIENKIPGFTKWMAKKKLEG